MSDFQRAKVYRAEARVRKLQCMPPRLDTCVTDPPPVCEGPPAPVWLTGPPLSGPVEAQALIDRIIREHYPALPAVITLKVDGRRTARAAAGRWPNGEFQVRYPRPPWTPFFAGKMLLLHEIAHCFDPSSLHGPNWCAVYLHLVDTYIGRGSAQALRNEFARGFVRVAKLNIETIVLSDREGEK